MESVRYDAGGDGRVVGGGEGEGDVGVVLVSDQVDGLCHYVKSKCVTVEKWECQ